LAEAVVGHIQGRELPLPDFASPPGMGGDVLLRKTEK